MVSTRFLTVEELEARGADSRRYELLEGVPHEVILTDLDRSVVVDNVFFPLATYVRRDYRRTSQGIRAGSWVRTNALACI
jgi:hypothetical protein